MFAIAIDGPAGAGKTTVAKRLAKELGFTYVDTGAMYRAVALHMLRTGTACENETGLERLLKNMNLSIQNENGDQRMFLNGEDVTDFLRTEEVSQMASKASAKPMVRERLLNLQREAANTNNVVMEGRDIGSCILPDAQLKIFLTADASVRAKRRYLELQEKGSAVTLEGVTKELLARDERDSSRTVSPLIEVPDSFRINSDCFTVDMVVQEIILLYTIRKSYLSKISSERSSV